MFHTVTANFPVEWGYALSSPDDNAVVWSPRCKIQSLVLSLSCQHEWQEETWWYCVTSHLQCSLKHLACNPKRLCVCAALPLFCGLFRVEHVMHRPHPPTEQLKTRWDQSLTHIIMDKLCITSNSNIGFNVWLRQGYQKGCKKTPSRWDNMHCLHQGFRFSPPESWNKVRRSVKRGLVARTEICGTVKSLQARQNVCVFLMSVSVCANFD